MDARLPLLQLSTMVWEQQERIKPITGGSKLDRTKENVVSGGLHPPFIEEGEERGDAVLGGDQTRRSSICNSATWRRLLERRGPSGLLSLSPAADVSLRPCPANREGAKMKSLKTTCKNHACSVVSTSWERGDIFKVIINAFQAADFREVEFPSKVTSDIRFYTAHLWENGRLRQELWRFVSERLSSPTRGARNTLKDDSTLRNVFRLKSRRVEVPRRTEGPSHLVRSPLGDLG